MKKSEEFWDKRAGDCSRREKRAEPKYNKAVENTKKLLNAKDTMLDFGCGPGLLTIQFSNDVKEIYAIDISSKMIEVAQRYAAENNIENINFSQSTIFDDRLKEESFSVIIAFNILHLLKDPQKVMSRINELLKPGGIFISETVCMGRKKSIFSFLLSLLSKIGLVPYINFLKLSDLKDLITIGNFQITETENLQPNPPTYYIVAKKQ